MQFILLILACVVAVGGYLYLCGLALVFIAFPAAVVGTGVGLAAGAVTGLAIVFYVLFGDQLDRVFSPADVAARRLWILRTPAAVRPDFAWPGYFVAQVWLDWWVAAERVTATAAVVWARSWDVVRRSGWFGLACWPLLLPVVVSLAAATAGMAAAVVFAGVLAAAVAAVVWALAAVVTAVLRALDRIGRTLRRSDGNCPRCYEVSARPVYRCPGRHAPQEAALHHDVRPGLLGLFHRRCGCGRRLPTMVLRAARSMDALCPLCGTDLHSGAGAATDIRVPVFGAPSSGKTHLVTAGVVGLLRMDGDVRITLADDHSRRTYKTFVSVVDSAGSASKTDASHQPIAVTLRLQQGKRDALLHVYDAAGEALANPDQNERFQYLDAARTLVFVLDPFAIPDIRQRYQRTFADLFRTANVSTDLPEPSYQGIVTRLHRYGVRTAQKRLAFVVSKRDLVVGLPGMDGLTDDPDAVRRWLVEVGADNLVQAAERDFGTVRYFFISAKERSLDDGPVRPFRWLLDDEPISLPGPRPPAERNAQEFNAT